MEDVNYLIPERRSQFDNLKDHSLSWDHLRPDVRNTGPAHTLILISNPALEPLLLNFSPNPPQVGTHSFWGHQTIVSPFAWQINKAILSYFTQNSLISILGTGTQRPSFWHQYVDVLFPYPLCFCLILLSPGPLEWYLISFSTSNLVWFHLFSLQPEWFICNAHLFLLFPHYNLERFFGICFLLLQPFSHSLYLYSFLLPPSTPAFQNLKI